MLKSVQRLLIVGNPAQTHIGGHFLQAALDLPMQAQLIDSNGAYLASWVIQKINWHLGKHRPANLKLFSNEVLARCRTFAPDLLLTTGLCPLNAEALFEIGKLGIKRLNFLTDDPWNTAHYAEWFMRALPHYDFIFTPRRSNISDLQKISNAHVVWLPFAYAPDLHFEELAGNADERQRFLSDVIFAGGADEDRIAYFSALIGKGFNVMLYGNYWNRYRVTRAAWRGMADPSTLRKAITHAKIALCLVRRANRDGHVMRSFEIPAVGTCMLAEDTEEHREIFGAEGIAVSYFNGINEMIEKVSWLLTHEDERLRMARAAHLLITGGKNTYRDRLQTMLQYTSQL